MVHLSTLNHTRRALVDTSGTTWYNSAVKLFQQVQEQVMLDRDRPVYTIGTAAEILQVHPRTLRLYEDGGLLRPARKNNRRFYSAYDLQWISCIRYLIHEKGLNQEGLRRLLAHVPCWELNGCSEEARAACAATSDQTRPCWAPPSIGGRNVRHCFECTAYLRAADYVLDEREKQEAINYVAPD
jgi:MerR family transcriptional regulator, heat shock protein HspR